MSRLLASLKNIRSEKALLSYLEFMKSLKVIPCNACPSDFDCLSDSMIFFTNTNMGDPLAQDNNCLMDLDGRLRTRMQVELYMLCTSGGPRYPPPRVRKAASTALDTLYPAGAFVRRVVAIMFYILHPTEWPLVKHVVYTAVKTSSWMAYGLACASDCLRCFWNGNGIWRVDVTSKISQ